MSLINCPECGRSSVSSTSTSCPSCGANVSHMLRVQKSDLKDDRMRKGLCEYCGSSNIRVVGVRYIDGSGYAYHYKCLDGCEESGTHYHSLRLSFEDDVYKLYKSLCVQTRQARTSWDTSWE